MRIWKFLACLKFDVRFYPYIGFWSTHYCNVSFFELNVTEKPINQNGEKEALSILKVKIRVVNVIYDAINVKKKKEKELSIQTLKTDLGEVVTLCLLLIEPNAMTLVKGEG